MKLIMKCLIFILLSSFYLISYANSLKSGSLTQTPFGARTDGFAAKMWPIIYIDLDNPSASVSPTNEISGADFEKASFLLKLPVNTTIRLYLDYPNYKGELTHGCEFTVTAYNPYGANFNQLYVKNSLMICSINLNDTIFISDNV